MNKLKARFLASIELSRPGVAEFGVALIAGILLAGAAIGNMP